MKKETANGKVGNKIAPSPKIKNKPTAMNYREQAVIEENQNKELEAPSKIEMIKNLIFGDNIQAYESEFEKVKQDILSKKKAMEDLIEAVQTDLRMALDDVSTDIHIRITELEGKIGNRLEDLEANQMDKKKLGDLLVELGEKIRKK